MNELEQLLAQANAAIQRGADPAAVNARLAEVSQGRFGSVAALGEHVRLHRVPARPEDPALERMNEDGGSALQDAARMAVQGASFGFADEVLGDRSVVEDNRRLTPGGSLAAELAGGALLPAAGGARVGAGIMARTGSRVAAGAAGGAAAGGLYGGANAAGEAEGGILDRLAAVPAGAGMGAGAGALLGGLFAPMGGAASRVARPGNSRVADDLRRLTGLSDDINGAIARADDAVNDVRQTMYRPIEEAHPQIGSAVPTEPQPLHDRLRAPDLVDHTRAVAREVAEGKRPPSFEEAQRILTRLRRVNKRDAQLTEQIGEVEQLLAQAVPEAPAADAAYAQAQGVRRALKMGERSSGWDSARVAREMDRLTDPAAREAFLTARFHNLVRRIETRQQGAVSPLREFYDAGPETQRVMRQFFPDDASYNEFVGILRSEVRADRIRAALGNALKLGAGAAGAGALFEGARRAL